MAVKWVTRQIERYPDNAFIITSRPLGYVSNPLPGAEILQTQRFTNDQIVRFLHNWYAAVAQRTYGKDDSFIREKAATEADDLVSRMRRVPALQELAANPLLLTMIVHVHRYRGALPGNRASLYEEMCDVLLFRRQEAKNLGDITEMSGSQKRFVVQRLALHMMRYRVRDLSAESAAAALREPLARVSGAAVTPSVFLKEVRRSGLLVERQADRYAFAHLILQEYLAARAIRDSGASPLPLLDEIGDDWWRETTLLWASMGDASEIVERCIRVGSVAALSLAFDCADIALELSPGVRNRIDTFAADAGGVSDNPEQRRLLARVAVARDFRERIWLDGIQFCVKPVKRSLFRLYLLEQPAEDERLAEHFRQVSEKPASGLGPRFLDWVNSLADGGGLYRLPTEDELIRADPPEQHSIWIAVDGAVALWKPDAGPITDTAAPLKQGSPTADDLVMLVCE